MHHATSTTASSATTAPPDRDAPWSRHQVRVAPGRSVAVHARAGSAHTVVVCHPAPGAGPFDPDPGATSRSGASLISVDRPGYGGSEPTARDAWASVEQAADDLARVLEARGVGPVGVAGWSAGGRVALALAARRPDLVDRVAIVATPAPHDQVPWMPPPVEGAIAALRGEPPHVAHAAFAAQLAEVLPADPRAHAALELLGASDADARVVADPATREALGALLGSAFEQGMTGLAADLAGITLRPWGFEPAEVRAPVLLVYGAADPVAGPAHGRWWQRSLADARLEIVADAGHLVVVPAWERVLEHLASPAR